MDKRVTLVRIVHGSHLFGTNQPGSDRDYKGVVVPSANELLLGTAPRTSWNENTKIGSGKNTSTDVDTELYTLAGFMRMLQEGQTAALEILFAPDSCIIERHIAWDAVFVPARASLVHKGVWAFFNYARAQAAKYGVKGSRVNALKRVLQTLNNLPDMETLEQNKVQFEYLRLLFKADSLETEPLISFVDIPNQKQELIPHLCVVNRKIALTCSILHTRKVFQKIYDSYGERAKQAERNEGIDWKALSHAVRVGDQAVELLETGQITLPRPNAEFLIAIKNGKVSYAEVADRIESVLTEIKKAQSESPLREKLEPDTTNAIIKHLHRAQILGGL